MAIGNKQIGWSQESNLLWEISKQLDNMDSIMCTGDCPTSTTTTSTTIAPITTSTTTTFNLCPNCIETPITIGTQTWTKCNLNVSTYRNGDLIPEVTDPIAWSTLTTGAWCYYNNDTANGTIYGKLYNWYAVNDPRGLAPLGQHVPTDTEWTTLTTFLGGEEVAGGKMKETGLCHWDTPNTDATNESGFTALPGGYRSNEIVTPGEFVGINATTYLWSSSVYATLYAWHRSIDYNGSNIYTSYDIHTYGFSVRCLID
jgi:uncharacterized protein (TIGR02145 family)